MDAHPIKSLITWLDSQSRPMNAVMAEGTSTDLGALKARIAAGEYRLDAHAIAEAMFGRAERELAAERPSQVLEASKRRRPARSVEQR